MLGATGEDFSLARVSPMKNDSGLTRITPLYAIELARSIVQATRRLFEQGIECDLSGLINPYWLESFSCCFCSV